MEKKLTFMISCFYSHTLNRKVKGVELDLELSYNIMLNPLTSWLYASMALLLPLSVAMGDFPPLLCIQNFLLSFALLHCYLTHMISNVNKNLYAFATNLQAYHHKIKIHVQIKLS